MRLLALLLVVSAGCCSNAALEAAEHQCALLRAQEVDRDPVVPNADACAGFPIVTFEDMKRGTHEGELVAVDGVPVRRLTGTCTLVSCVDSCGRELRHCNSCESGLALVLDGALVDLMGPGFGCQGYECAMRCEPFGKNRRRYRFVGRYQGERTPNGTTHVTVTAERWCHTPEAEGS